jgi:hypothetical protein
MYNVDILAPGLYVADSSISPNQYASVLKNDDGTAKLSIYAKGNVHPIFETTDSWERISKILTQKGFNVEIEPPQYKWWGGKREGAGRPSTGRKRRQYYVTDEEDAQIKKLIDQLRNPSE